LNGADPGKSAEDAARWASAARVPAWKYVGLFAIIYVPLMIVAAIILSLMDAKSSHGVNVGCLAAASLSAAYAFARKHGRPFIGAEYWTVLGGSIAVNLVMQTVPTIPMFLSGKLTMMTYFLAMAFIGILHGLFLAVMYSSFMVEKYVRRPPA
jgi:hypothetical protein